MQLVGLLLSIVGLICAVIILIDAFQDAIWKGIVGLLCGLYLIYYGIFEFENDNKWLIVILFLVGTFGGTGLRFL